MDDKYSPERVKEYRRLRELYFKDRFADFFDYALEFFDFNGSYVTRKSLRFLSRLSLLADFACAMDQMFHSAHESNFDEVLRLQYSRNARKSIDFDKGLHTTIKKKMGKQKLSPKNIKSIRILFGLDGIYDKTTELEKQEFDLIKNEVMRFVIGKYGEYLSAMYISHYVYGESFSELASQTKVTRQSLHKELTKIHKSVISHYKEKNASLEHPVTL